jgi:putative hydrolase of the HAD superfamily
MSPAVVFDLGKVLLDFDYSIAARNIAARGKMTPEELGVFILGTSLLLDYETGLMTSKEFYGRICSATGYCGSLEEFAATFGDIFAPIGPMVELHSQLRRRGFSTYVFSNTNDLAIRFVRKNYAFFSQFDGYILSYEHRAMKPDATLYEVVERITGRQGRDLLYIDDRPENIATGAARGWQVILQECPERTIGQIREFGLLDGPG